MGSRGSRGGPARRCMHSPEPTGSTISAPMGWTFIWLMLLLKIPIGGLLWIVWWAIHKTDEEPVGGARRGRRQQGRRGAPASSAPAAVAAPAPRPAHRRAAAGAAADAQRRRARPQGRALTAPRRPRGPSAPIGALGRHDPPARRRGRDLDRPVGRGARPAGERRRAARQLVPRLPQLPRLGDRPARPADQPDRADHDRARRAVRDPPRRVLPRRDARVRRAARRHRRPDRGQVLARTARPDRARDRRLLRSGLAAGR